MAKFEVEIICTESRKQYIQQCLDQIAFYDSGSLHMEFSSRDFEMESSEGRTEFTICIDKPEEIEEEIA